MKNKSYLVVVKAANNPDYTAKVRAPREGLAKTQAMLHYPYKLAGALVSYEIEEVK